jgi:hypothetical protein
MLFVRVVPGAQEACGLVSTISRFGGLSLFWTPWNSASRVSLTFAATTTKFLIKCSNLPKMSPLFTTLHFYIPNPPKCVRNDAALRSLIPNTSKILPLSHSATFLYENHHIPINIDATDTALSTSM